MIIADLSMTPQTIEPIVTIGFVVWLSSSVPSRNMNKSIIFSILVLFAGFGIASAQYAVGDTAANFTLPDSGRNMVSLYDYADRIVLIEFWNPG